MQLVFESSYTVLTKVRGFDVQYDLRTKTFLRYFLHRG